MENANSNYRRVRSALRALLDIRDVIDTGKGYLEGGTFDQLEEEVSELTSVAPGLLPSFNRGEYYLHDNDYGSWFDRPRTRAFVARAVARLQVEVEANEAPPGTKPLTFPFIKSSDVRTIVERDYRELQSAQVARCWKSVLVLAGGCIEGILYDLVTQNSAAAQKTQIGKTQPDVTKWTLGQLVSVALELKLVQAGVSKLSPGLKDYRNLVHPAVEVREALVPGEEEATVALAVLHMLHRDLV